MAKFTEEQIKREIPEAKSLRWLAINFPKIENPKNDVDRMQNCIHNYCSNAANLIDRQEAEIERLKKRNEMLSNTRDSVLITHARELRRAKSEAIKEFAERLKRSLTEYPVCYFKEPVTSTQIDNLVEEMVGEGE